jgi:hypothetical protein
VEIKKTGHPLDEKKYDFLKIRTYIDEIHYDYGAYVEFGVKDDVAIKKVLLFLPGSPAEDITHQITVKDRKLN